MKIHGFACISPLHGLYTRCHDLEIPSKTDTFNTLCFVVMLCYFGSVLPVSLLFCSGNANGVMLTVVVLPCVFCVSRPSIPRLPCAPFVFLCVRPCVHPTSLAVKQPGLSRGLVR